MYWPEREHEEVQARMQKARGISKDCRQGVVRRQERKEQIVVPIPNEARDPIIDRYIHFSFGRGVNEPNTPGEMPLVEAMKDPDIDGSSMFMLLEHPGVELYCRSSNNYGNTALRCAIKAPSLNVRNINMLLDNGIDVN